MKSLYEFFKQSPDTSINEKLITFNNQAYPKFGNVVIMAGGAASGKGYIKDNLLGIEGNVFDVDAIKILALKSDLIKKLALEQTGKDISTFDLKDPKDVSTLHTILDKELKIVDKRNTAKYVSIILAPEDRKPNLIFDVTLKDMSKLRIICDEVTDLGYKKENIHIVWVINDVNVAIQQNRDRKRSVPEDILMSTHKGASQTAKDIIDLGEDINKYLNGDIWYVFNKKGVDIKTSFSGNGGSAITDANYIKVKASGKPIDKSKITQEVIDKIVDYVPNVNYW